MRNPETQDRSQAPGEWADDWKTGRPEDHGFRAGFAEQLDEAIANGELPGLHGIVMAGGGRLILERYLTGEDQCWGKPLGQVAFTPQTLHDLRSVSKSIVGLLYGIACHEGKAPPLEAPLLDQFGAYPDLVHDPTRAALKVSHVITMTMGLEWNEDVPYDDPANSEIGMEMAPDRYRFILERPFIAAPGERWIYNGGASALLGRLIELGSGMSLLDFARVKLFDPLGITQVEWVTGADGVYSAASGLRLRPRDLAKIGQLILQHGTWQGQAVVPHAWLNQALTTRIPCFDDVHYGYQWYVRDATDGHGKRVFALGNGGQRLIVLPQHDLIVAILCGRYNQPDQWKAPAAIMLQHVLPNLTPAT